MKFNGRYVFFLILLILSCNNRPGYPSVTTFAGNGNMGSANGQGSAASFANLMGIAVDQNGNLYIADSHNNLIRKISPDGKVSTLAGNGQQGSEDGTGSGASFFGPEGITVDRYGNVFVADTHNNLIRKITPAGVVTTLAGPWLKTKSVKNDSAGKLDTPTGIAVDEAGNIYFTDRGNDLIRKIDPDGTVSILAGTGDRGSEDGPALKANFYLPGGIAVDRSGNVYVADTYNNMIRKISRNGMVSLVAGQAEKGSRDGKGKTASFLHPEGLTLDSLGNIFVADMGNNKIRKITPDGIVTTIAGNGFPGKANGRDTIAGFNKPYGVAISRQGTLYVADYQNNQVRQIAY